MKRLSIKLRVTLWFTLFMALLVALALILLFFAGHEIVSSTLRDTLTETVAENGQAVRVEHGTLDTENVDSFSGGVYLMVYDEEGYPIYGRMPMGYADQMPFRDGVMQTMDDWYLYDALISVEDYGQVWIRGVVSSAEAKSTVYILLRLAVIAFPGLMLLAAIGGYFITIRAFRPVRQIAETAEQIGGGKDLSRRIQLGEGRDEIYTLAATFDRMFDRLEASFQRERQFTSDASHELRTPIAVIISQCEYALDHAVTSDEAQDALNTVLQQAQRMSALIAQLLTLARADRGQTKLQLETVNLSELTQIVADQVSEQAARRAIRVETRIQPGLCLQGDETLLLRMLLNLMENGVKYGKEGGCLTVRLFEQGRQMTGEIQDDGIGIAPEHLPHIWERFYQVDTARSAAREGIGLGLPMVQYIVQAHGGSITVESTLGKGSLFTFCFPTEKNEKSSELNAPLI